MIEITRIKNEHGENIGFRCLGHAGFAKHGKDIVCASVSSIVYTTINAVKRINFNAIEVVDEKSMEIKILVEDETINILIDNMLDLLNSLASDYPKNICVKEN